MTVEKIAYGAGQKEFPDRPNVLRLVLGQSSAAWKSDEMLMLETNIDDMNPEIYDYVFERLFKAGAREVFLQAIQMKKNRPGTLLSIIAPPEARDRLTSIVFRESTTIGIRYIEMKRECLARETTTVDTPFGPVAIKIARRNGEILNASPEFDDCARIAAERGRPVKDVHAAAVKAFLDRH